MAKLYTEEQLEKFRTSLRQIEDQTIYSGLVEKLEELTKSRNPSNYLLLPQTEEHPDLLVPLNRLAYGPEVEAVAKELKLNLRNNIQGYIGNINFEQANALCLSLDGFMNTPSYLAETLRILNSGKAFDGAGRKLQNPEKAFKDITGQKNPWRSEWLKHIYSKKDNQLQVTYHKFDSSEHLIQVTEPLDEDTLTKDKKISLEDWVNNPTSQGLPKNSVKDGSLYYWQPKEGRVAGFIAYAGRAGLYCVGGASYSNANLGVRVVGKK